VRPIAPDVIGTLIGDKTPAVVFRYSRHAPKNAGAEAVEMLAKARGQAVEVKLAEKPAGKPAEARSASA
jgi:hypothetical protein